MNSEENNKNPKNIKIKEGKGGYGGQHKVVDKEKHQNESSKSENEEE